MCALPGSVDMSPSLASRHDPKSEKADATSAASSALAGPDPTNDPEEQEVEAGMQSGLKYLYAGKEDKRGRYQWQDTIPEDVGHPAENAETAKWALLVRNVKVYNDPRRVLRIHSILVQSPLLKTLLVDVLNGYPGVTAALQRLELSGKFEPIIHRWGELQRAIEALDSHPLDACADKNRVAKEHAQLFFNLLKGEFKDLIEMSQDMRAKGVMTYEHLWTLFQPGAIVYSRQDGQETAMKLHDTRYCPDSKGNPCFWVVCKFVDWDGSRFGLSKVNILIQQYPGTRPIPQLAVYPLEYHHDPDALQARLVERGTKCESLAGCHYRSYNGVGWRRGNFGVKDKYAVKGRIVIDTYSWNRFNPGYPVFVGSLTQKDHAPPSGVVARGNGVDDDDDGTMSEYSSNPSDGMPFGGHFADEDEREKMPLSTEQRLIFTPLLRGYSVKKKLWLNFFVDCVHEIEWQAGAFDRLVLPANQKELILGFTESQRKYRDSFDDVIEGKGKGVIILLCGSPGVGKTLTAESIAEEMRVPLYMMSAGDLGLDPREVESSLGDILEMCTRWSAILLLDEADVFLEERSLHELERNKLVSIFLRVLEYYEGIMFLTSNRVQTFDPAFQSRIHISLEYPELSIESRLLVWKNFLGVLPLENTITATQLEQLSLMNMNGRQIKNVLKTAQLLAHRNESKLNHEHIMTVLDVTQHLHNSTREKERTRASIFS